LQPALSLGRRAVVLGLETLELARMHERALARLEVSKLTNGATKRAQFFFAEALTPIVETHRAARQRKIELNRLNETLGRRTARLAATHRQLQRRVIRRQAREDAGKKNGKQLDRCLEESRLLQAHLRQLTHRALVAQEHERKKISCELQNEIAQTLLGINVRLVSLKQQGRRSARGLKNEIASAQQLVLKSARSVRKFARELNLGQPV